MFGQAEISNPEAPARLKQERERVALTVAQLASLMGVSNDDQQGMETGLVQIPFDYVLEVRRAGMVPEYISMGENPPSKTNIRKVSNDLRFCDEQFREAVTLMRKSMLAVEAWVGEGAAKQQPALVAALMQATLTLVFADDDSRSDAVDAITGAIAGAGDAIVAALTPDQN